MLILQNRSECLVNEIIDTNEDEKQKRDYFSKNQYNLAKMMEKKIKN